jgi:hypothetical protein
MGRSGQWLCCVGQEGSCMAEHVLHSKPVVSWQQCVGTPLSSSWGTRVLRCRCHVSIDLVYGAQQVSLQQAGL